MTEHSRYVHAFVAQLEIMHLLAQRSNAAVFKCIELFAADPQGATKRDILDYTGLSRHTVEHALRTLEQEGIAYFTPETRRYRLAPQYVSYRGPEPQSIRELVPIVPGEPRNPRGLSSTGQNILAIHDDVVFQDPVPGSKSLTSSYMARREIFSHVGFRGPNLDKIAQREAPIERARAWADWVEQAQAAPKQYAQPFGYALKVYVADPFAEPPPITEAKGQTWYEEHRWIVHGTREHARYKRDNPGVFDCNCPAALKDEG